MCLMRYDLNFSAEAARAAASPGLVFRAPVTGTSVVTTAGDCPDSAALAALNAFRTARRPPVMQRTVAQIVRAGQVYAPVLDRTSGAVIGREASPELVRLLRGPHGAMRALAFIASCRADDALRAQAESQGIDLDEWEDWIRVSTSDIC
jgi:hypothetical protein